jgi:periplasmic mercuric ion binding protein
MKKSFCLAAALTLATFSVQAATIEMKVHGMVCGFCAQGIEASLRKNPAVVDVMVSLETKLVVVETRGTEDIADSVLKKSIADAGYDLKSVTRTERALADYRADIGRTTK